VGVPDWRVADHTLPGPDELCRTAGAAAAAAAIASFTASWCAAATAAPGPQSHSCCPAILHDNLLNMAAQHQVAAMLDQAPDERVDDWLASAHLCNSCQETHQMFIQQQVREKRQDSTYTYDGGIYIKNVGAAGGNKSHNMQHGARQEITTGKTFSWPPIKELLAWTKHLATTSTFHKNIQDNSKDINTSTPHCRSAGATLIQYITSIWLLWQQQPTQSLIASRLPPCAAHCLM